MYIILQCNNVSKGQYCAELSLIPVTVADPVEFKQINWGGGGGRYV